MQSGENSIGTSPQLVQVQYPAQANQPLQLKNKVFAQGNIEPAGGVIQIAALPGNRVAEVLVSVGQSVSAGDKLVTLSTERLKSAELSLAKQKKVEAIAQADATRAEADLKVDAAELTRDSAKAQLTQAKKNLQLVRDSESQLELAAEQINRLRELRDNPKTRPLVGSLEVSQKEIEFSQAEQKFKQQLATAEQAVFAAELAVTTAEKQLTAANRSRELVESAIPLLSLDKQIRILRLQIIEMKVNSPVDGVVLSIATRKGEVTAQLPIMEMANVKSMICNAEVAEASIRRIAIGDPVKITSAAIEGVITGTVERIDTIIGKPQLGLPNPMAKRDFRAVPVRIKIDDEHAAAAAKLIRLQVNVEIEVGTKRDESATTAIEPAGSATAAADTPDVTIAQLK